MSERLGRTYSAVCIASFFLLPACAGPNQSVAPAPPDQTAPSARSQSWTSPLARRTAKLLYVSAYGGSSVGIYDYPTGKQVGVLHEFATPNGLCVDAKGDVYIANFQNGMVDEYSHGGKKLIEQFATAGSALGCSVDEAGDLAVTDAKDVYNSGPGSVTVFKKGTTQGTVYSNAADCYYIGDAGYDDKGNLVMAAENQAFTAVTFCGLLKGSGSLQLLTAKGFSIHSPGSTMWDGKYLALTDQNVDETGQSAIVRASLSGSTLTYHNELTLSDTCYDHYTHVVQPFIVGTENTPVNQTQGKTIIGGNEFCNGGVRFWHYPAGGAPYKSLSAESAGEAVSIRS